MAYSGFEQFVESKDRINIGKELRLSKDIGNPVGIDVSSKPDIVQKMLPIVKHAFKTLGKNTPLRDIEEMLEDGLRLAILAVGGEGESLGTAKTSSTTSDFLKQAEKRRTELEQLPKGDASLFGQMPDSYELWHRGDR